MLVNKAHSQKKGWGVGGTERRRLNCSSLRKRDSDGNLVTFNFWGNKANTEWPNPGFLFAVDTKYTAAITAIMLGFL